MLKKIWQYFKPYTFFIILATISSGIVAASQGAVAYAVKPTLDGIFINKDKSMLILMPVVIIVLFLIKGVFSFAQEFLMRYSAQRAVQKIRDDLYGNIIMLPVRFFSENSTGLLMSRITSDINLVESSIPSMVSIMSDFITLVALTCVVFYQDPVLAIFAYISFPFLGTIVVKIGSKMKRYTRKGQEKMADLTSILQEAFSGIRVIKAFVTENLEKEKFKKKNAEFVKYSIKRIVVSAMSTPLMEILGTIGVSLVVYFGGLHVINSSSTPGTFFSFMTAVMLMYEPFKKINKNNHTVQSAVAAAERVFEVMDIENEVLLNNGRLGCDARNKDIEFKDVFFRYEDNEPFILKDISFKASPDSVVAIVGPSGAGKTTIINLIPRFYDVSKGEILIGGVNVRDFKIYSLRKSIGIIGQESFLFNDTVRNNIAYGYYGASDEEIFNVAKISYADEFIKEMPSGYNTIIGERGVKLSGGQRQRITIARALLKNPPILIMDEATSSLDTESERIVQKALENLMKGRTCFVIAHRLSTILNADIIIVLSGGKIDAIGRHSELLAQSELYARLYELQFADEAGRNNEKATQEVN